jgi:cytochrome b subunit of formate dehydrogenase
MSTNFQEQEILDVVSRNKIIILIASFVLFFLGAFFAFVDIFDLYETLELAKNPYAWGFACFFWSFLFLSFIGWKHQNKILHSAAINERNIIQKAILQVEEKLSSNGEWKFHTFHLFSSIFLLIFIEGIILSALVFIYFNLEEDSIEAFLENINVLPYIFFVSFIVFISGLFFIWNDFMTLSHSFVERKNFFSSVKIYFNEIKK